MPKKEVPVDFLQNYLPAGTVPAVTTYLHQYHVHLTITRQRDSILGDYRHRTDQQNHRISVNSNLNKYAFLITLLHELAHLLCYEQHRNKVMAHGREWKAIYGELLKQFLQQKLFPSDIELELLRSLKDPAASSCAEVGLLRVLRNYDEKNGHHFIEEIKPGSLFRLKDGRVFQKGERLRKRFRCVEVKTGKVYLFSPVYEVELVVQSS
jgi:SprT protein